MKLAGFYDECSWLRIFARFHFWNSRNCWKTMKNFVCLSLYFKIRKFIFHQSESCVLTMSRWSRRVKICGSKSSNEVQLQSTPVISRLLGAKICERELSGSPVISRFPAKATTCHFQCHRPTYMTYSGVYKSQTVCWAIIEVLTFPGSLHTSTSHQRQITTSNIRF